MEYLKLFEMFNKDDIILTCHEMLLELTDIGYKCCVEFKKNHNIYVKISRKGFLPRWSRDNVIDYLARIDDYLEQNNFNIVNFSNTLELENSELNTYFVFREYKCD